MVKPEATEVLIRKSYRNLGISDVYTVVSMQPLIQHPARTLAIHIGNPYASYIEAVLPRALQELIP